MPYIRFAPPTGSTDPFYHRRATCAPSSSSCRPSSGPSFNPIADILSALESEFTGSKPQSQPQSQPKRQTTNPHFDVVETEDAYILEGELPGVSDKRSIDIEFSDAQTLVVKGQIKKKSHDKKQQQELDDLVASEVSEFVADQQPQEDKIEDVKSTSSAESVRSFKPTVEETIDESESGSENDFEVVDSPSTAYKGKGKATSPQVAEKPTTPTPSEPEKTVDSQKKEEPAVKISPPVPAPNHKYWITERSVGDFARSFTFQSLIDQDSVKATLEHGILEIVVPKRQPYVRRVQIQ